MNQRDVKRWDHNNLRIMSTVKAKTVLQRRGVCMNKCNPLLTDVKAAMSMILMCLRLI